MQLPWPRLKRPVNAARAASRAALLLLLAVVLLNALRRLLIGRFVLSRLSHMEVICASD
jgi:hypothetical protein